METLMNKKEFKMMEGEKLSRNPNKPIIGITGTGVRTYLWVGNDDENDKACFATLSGAKTLEKFACNILNALGHDGNSIKKMIYKKNGR